MASNCSVFFFFRIAAANLVISRPTNYHQTPPILLYAKPVRLNPDLRSS